jgi:GNAT superfamily N-acetyltransferase
MAADSARMAITKLPVRRLGVPDLPACLDLTADRGWPPEPDRWRLLLAVSEAYGVDDPAGGLAGVVVLTRYGPGLAAVGMMLVASRHGRQGLGRHLMEHVLGQTGSAVVYLTATDIGRPLYQRLGFRAVDTSTRHIGLLTAESKDTEAHRLRRVTAAGVAAICAVDREVFGAERTRVLAELATFAEAFVECGEPVGGYAAGWRNADTMVIGPIVAADQAMATSLISCLAGGWAGPIRLDVFGRHQGLAAWARARGLKARDASTVMVRGGALPGDRTRLFGPVTVAIG